MGDECESVQWSVVGRASAHPFRNFNMMVVSDIIIMINVELCVMAVLLEL